jgi:AAA15 family ATPase/GTPase
MPKPTSMEMQAIKNISSKETITKITNLGFRSTFILNIYHKTGRKGKDFEIALNKALENTEDVLKKIENIKDMTRKQMQKYDALKESIVYYKMMEELGDKKDDVS